MRVVGTRVLIEQTMTKKKSAIILTKNAKQEEKFDVDFKIIQIGDEVPAGKFAVGEKPIFGKYVDFHGVKVISKEEEKEVIHCIVGYEDIIGIDD